LVFLVPYHISQIRRIPKTDTNYLRIIFKHPGRKNQVNDLPQQFKDPNLPFISEMTYKFEDTDYLQAVINKINESVKEVKNKDKRQLDRITFKEQPDLVINRRHTLPKLPGVIIKPHIGGRKFSGTLEAHANGFRYNVKGGTVDIIYDNIKKWFFQRTSGSLSNNVIIHFHLHNPIMIKNKKTKNIQFYTEVGESSLNIGKVGRLDREEEEAERRDRAMEERLNKQFKSFCNQVQKLGHLQYEEPHFDLGFSGVPLRDNVVLLPTESCLINLIEYPFFVLCIEDVHIAFFERVQLNLNSFDLVFVMKDFSQKEVHITCIPREHIEGIKSWLNSKKIKYYQVARSLLWTNVLNTLRTDPKEFWDRGAWNYYTKMEKYEEDSEEMSGHEYKPPSLDESDEEIIPDEKSNEETPGNGSKKKKKRIK